jgi:hypothetical protein
MVSEEPSTAEAITMTKIKAALSAVACAASSVEWRNRIQVNAPEDELIQAVSTQRR